MVFWVLSLLLSPAPSTSHLVLGLAVIAAVLVIAAAAGLKLLVPFFRAAFRPAVRLRRRTLPRLLDPDAAGRPRPRAPSGYPAVA
jgi:hypothetical protein